MARREHGLSEGQAKVLFFFFFFQGLSIDVLVFFFWLSFEQ